MPNDSPSRRYQFKLFINGQTEKSELAVANLRLIISRLGCVLELQVIDILEKPELAEEYRILATPTLIRYAPLPIRRIIGDLSNVQKVSEALGLPWNQQNA